MGKSLIARFDPNLTADESQPGVREHAR
jgi:hypothetical protein